MGRRSALGAAGYRALAGGGSGPSSETWTGTNGAGWAAGWTINPSGAATIQSNRGRLTAGAGGYASAWWGGVNAVTDFNLTVNFKATGGQVFVGVGAAATAWSSPDNGHYARIDVDSSTSLGYASVRRGGTELAFAFSGATADATNGWSVRMQRSGNTVRIKLWTAGGTEPGTWLIDTTDSSPYSYATDRAWLSYGASNGSSADFDDLTFGA